MNKNEKPLTECRRKRLNNIYVVLKGGTSAEPISKSLLQSLHNLDERQVRDIISEIAHRFPVVSLSASKGYFILPDFKTLKDNTEIAKHTAIRDHAIAELQSRIDELQKRIEPLRAWGF
jgi:hypothetical protein